MKKLLALCLSGLLLTGCGGIHGPVKEEWEWKLKEEDALILSDGTAVDRWQKGYSGYDFYKLKDGTELLREEHPSGPENVYVGGRESFTSLPEHTAKAISAYYDDMGLLYDLETEVEGAYQEYLTCQAEKTEFSSHLLGQSTNLCASNETVVYLETSVKLPLDRRNGRYVTEYDVGAAFDRETGKVIPVWDLFTLPEEDVKALIVEEFAPRSEAERAEMLEKLTADYLVFQPDSLNVFFPQGVISTQAHSSGVGIEYSELTGVLHDWAVPDPMK